MKFIFSKDIRDNESFTLILRAYLLLSLLFYIFLFYIEEKNFGLLPRSIQNKILGNNGLFISAMSFQDIILNSHIKLFLYLFSSLVLLVVLVRTKMSDKIKVNLSLGLFLFLFLDNLLVFVISWWSGFAYLKSASFLILQLMSLFILAYNLLFLFSKPTKRTSPSRKV